MIPGFSAAHFAGRCEPVIGQVNAGMAGEQIAQAPRDIYGVEVRRMKLPLFIHGDAPIFLPARAAEDQGEGWDGDLPLIGA